MADQADIADVVGFVNFHRRKLLDGLTELGSYHTRGAGFNTRETIGRTGGYSDFSGKHRADNLI
jgi:hypothetical protein